MSTEPVKKTRNRVAKALSPGDIIVAARKLPLSELIEVVRELKATVVHQIEQQTKLAESAKDL